MRGPKQRYPKQALFPYILTLALSREWRRGRVGVGVGRRGEGVEKG